MSFNKLDHKMAERRRKLLQQSCRCLSIILFVFGTLYVNALDTKEDSSQNRIRCIYSKIDLKDDIGIDSLGSLYTLLGYQYTEQLKYDSAYKYYDLALKIANKTSNKIQLANINNNIGSFYYNCGNFEEARKYYEISYGIYKQINNLGGISGLANNLGEIERLNGLYGKAISLYHTAVGINKKIKNHSFLSLNYNNLGLAYAEMKDFDSSLFYLKLAEKIAIEHKFSENLNIISNSLGTYYMLINELDSSYFYLSNAYRQSVEQNYISQIKENANALSQLFEQKGNLDSAFIFHKIFKDYSDSILNSKSLVKMKLLIVKNEMDNEMRIERLGQKRKELFYLVIIISAILTSIIFLLLIINQRNKAHHSKLKMEHLSLEKKYLNNELTNFALHISENNSLIEEMKQCLRNIELNRANKEQVNELKLKLNSGLPDEQNIKILEQKVNELHNDFIYQLQEKHPALTKSELNLCILLKLNLSTKDIAAINKVNPQSVKVARYRLRKKLNLDSQEKISDYLNSI